MKQECMQKRELRRDMKNLNKKYKRNKATIEKRVRERERRQKYKKRTNKQQRSNTRLQISPNAETTTPKSVQKEWGPEIHRVTRLG
jgi:hypothetical protein